MTLEDQLRSDLAKAELKAWESLARYKFWMFGYHAADVVRINRRLRLKRPNPFRVIVMVAREVLKAWPQPASIPREITQKDLGFETELKEAA